MNWFSKNHMRLRFQQRVDALRKAGIPVNQQTVYDETLVVDVPVPTSDSKSGRRQSDYRVQTPAFVARLFTSSMAAGFRHLMTPHGPTVFAEANRQYFRQGGVKQRAVTSTLLLAAGLVCAGWAGSIAYQGLSSSSWPTTAGVIASSAIAMHEGDRSAFGRRATIYSAKVRYTYTVGNRPYTADRVRFGDYGSSHDRRAQQIQARFPAGAAVQVHYDPRRPEIAVLETGSTWFMNLWVGLGALLAVCGMVGLVRAGQAQRIYREAESPSAHDSATRT